MSGPRSTLGSTYLTQPSHAPTTMAAPGAASFAGGVSQAMPLAHDGNGAPIPISDQLMQIDQAITMTLQEIDANMAAAHQTVTSRILPLVKRYGVASARSWQGAKFWLKFFEASANVSLNPTVSQGGEDHASTYDQTSHTFTSDIESLSPAHRMVGDNGHHLDVGDDSEDGTGFFQSAKHANASSPYRLLKHTSKPSNRDTGDEDGDQSTASWAPIESPFERLKREMEGTLETSEDPSISGVGSVLEFHRNQQRELAQRNRENAQTHVDDANRDRTQGAEHDDLVQRIDHLDVGNGTDSHVDEPPRLSRPFADRDGAEASGSSPRKNQGTTPRLLQKVLSAEQRKQNRHLQGDTSVQAALNVPYPRIQATPRGKARRGNPFESSGKGAGRWDGIADLRKTPLSAAGKNSKKQSKPKGHKEVSQPASASDWEDSDDDDTAWPEGMSPPVTMQFSVPQSRYAKTPAKEAARMVVDDLLRTVGGTSPALRDYEQRKESAKQRTAADNLNAQPSSLVGTPLRKAQSSGKDGSMMGAQQRRDSLPTPPTLTHRPHGAPRQSTTPVGAPPLLATTRHDSRPSKERRESRNAVGTGRAAMLLDEGEGGDMSEDDSIADNETRATEHTTDVAHENKLLPRTGTSASSHRPSDANRLPEEEEDEDSDSESDDDSESEEEAEPQPNPAAPYQYTVSNPRASQQHSGWTSSAESSQFTNAGSHNDSNTNVTRNIDQDTLFGIRDLRGSSNGSVGSATRSSQFDSSNYAPRNATRAGTKRLPSGGVSGTDFRPWGAVDEMGTIGGRPLLAEDGEPAPPTPLYQSTGHGAGRR